MMWIVGAFILGVPLFFLFPPLGALVFLILFVVGLVKLIKRNGGQSAVVNAFAGPDPRG